MTNILQLHTDLYNHTYHHGGYEHFVVTDPKRRDIHKASVRDRLVHHAIYRTLYFYFDNRFIDDSYSCRNNKGTHRAIKQFQKFARKVSNNHTRTCYVLKCDIRKSFASIDHEVLLSILEKQIPDKHIIALLQEVISSFHSTTPGKGLPLGNLTSQLLVNIYMNEFDQYCKQTLKAKHYIRYADDFIFLHHDKKELTKIVRCIVLFLQIELQLQLHPNKVSIETIASGVDFLGWVQFPQYTILRRVTRRRVLKKLQDPNVSEATRQSYLGLLRQGNTYGLLQSVRQDREGV